MNRVFLIIILLVAAGLRFFALDKYPVGLFGDEVDVGYQAYSLLKTGKDYMGQTLPTYIHSLSEWRAPLFIYATVPSVAIFGLNELGVRAGSAFFGVLGVFLIYLLSKKLWGEKVGLFSALLLAILPWHIHYSRAAFEVTLLLDLVLAGVLLYLDSTKRKAFLYLSAVCFALTFYTYSIATLFTPLFLALLIFVQKDYLNPKKVVTFGGVIALVLLPFLYQLFFGEAGGRFSLISVFSDDTLIDRVNIERSETGEPSERLFHNKFITWGEAILANYTRVFSPEFLFINGDPNPRHNVPQTGMFYWAYSLFLLFALIVIPKVKHKALLISWLLLAPLASSLTRDGGVHATRLFITIPPLIFVLAHGASHLFEKRRLLFLFTFAFVIFNFGFYVHRYYTHYPLQQFRYWHYGFKDAMQAVVKNESNYKRVFINNTAEPALLHYLFWSKYDPERFQREFTGDRGQDKVIRDFNGFKLNDKVYFGEFLGEPYGFIEDGEMYLGAQGKEIAGDWDLEKSAPASIKVLNVTRNPKGFPIYSLITRK